MDPLIKLELQVKILEKMVDEIIRKNSLIHYPDPSDQERIKMEAYQEMKQAYPNEKVEYPRS